MPYQFSGQPVNAGTYKNIVAQTGGTLVKTGQGVLHIVTLNKPVATAVITFYDGLTTGGTVMGTITVPASPQPQTLEYNITFNTGLFVVLATADMDFTINYR